ncbi:MAG: glutamine synthetase beta-grasp domain-containing protein, partial [Thermobifida fusca]|nr:glutamine synthetase beta-grasp domain-containing protein [Thermobifida fusca]
MFSNADEALAYIRTEGVQFVDVRFTDLFGGVHHVTLPAEKVDEDFLTNGQMFDGSSIRGFQAIHESDMLLLPDLSTAVLDPFREYKTLNITFFVHDPLTRECYSRDPRNVARKAEAYLKSTGIADTAYFGPEAEFYIFDDVQFATAPNTGFYA